MSIYDVAIETADACTLSMPTSHTSIAYKFDGLFLNNIGQLY